MKKNKGRASSGLRGQDRRRTGAHVKMPFGSRFVNRTPRADESLPGTQELGEQPVAQHFLVDNGQREVDQAQGQDEVKVTAVVWRYFQLERGPQVFERRGAQVHGERHHDGRYGGQIPIGPEALAVRRALVEDQRQDDVLERGRAEHGVVLVALGRLGLGLGDVRREPVVILDRDKANQLHDDGDEQLADERRERQRRDERRFGPLFDQRALVRGRPADGEREQRYGEQVDVQVLHVGQVVVDRVQHHDGHELHQRVAGHELEYADGRDQGGPALAHHPHHALDGRFARRERTGHRRFGLAQRYARVRSLQGAAVVGPVSAHGCNTVTGSVYGPSRVQREE